MHVVKMCPPSTEEIPSSQLEPLSDSIRHFLTLVTSTQFYLRKIVEGMKRQVAQNLLQETGCV